MSGEPPAHQAEAWFVARTMRALELIAFEPLSAPRVGHLLDIHPRTARRLLNRLVVEGYAARTPDRRYAPTMRLVALASQLVDHAALTRIARPFVEQASKRAGHAAQLAIPSYRSVLCLLRGGDDGSQAGLGELAPSHCTAAGKALMAFRDAWRDSILSRELVACTTRSVVDPVSVRAEAIVTLERGYAVEDGEYREDRRAVAAPVFADGDAIAALAVVTPRSTALERLSDIVVELAAELSTALSGAV